MTREDTELRLEPDLLGALELRQEMLTHRQPGRSTSSWAGLERFTVVPSRGGRILEEP